MAFFFTVDLTFGAILGIALCAYFPSVAVKFKKLLSKLLHKCDYDK